jgi:Tol biopolymer transport system component
MRPLRTTDADELCRFAPGASAARGIMPALPPTLAAGTRLGPYEIVAPLGRGGMGDVYRARDTRLDRPVAVKTVRSDLAQSPEARERFEREARAISRLSHPHICALYDVGHADGTEYLVMELLEGETLANLIAKGPVPIVRVLSLGIEIAGALSAAHRQGIVHRDLKPGNLMVTKAGVKLLDFGLAKAIEAPVTGGGKDEAATTTGAHPLTAKGSWLGTAPYMAPEQIQGRPADARSDVFALGAVLYEMAAGRRAFEGRTTAEIASAVLHQDPPAIASAGVTVPPAFEQLVRECLAKDPDARWQATHDVSLQLAGLRAAAPPQETAPPASRTRLAGFSWVLAAAAIASALVMWWRLDHAQRPAPDLVEVQLMPPEGEGFYYFYDAVTFALSPDGAQLAFIAADPTGELRVWLRSPTSVAARPLRGTESATSVFWSPDGRSLAFFAMGTLKRLDLASGVAVPVCNVQKTIGLSGTWNAAGRMLFASVEGQAIFGISAAGGAATEELTPDASRDEARVLFPTFLPDGRRFLYLLRMRDGSAWLMLGEHGKPAHRVMPAESNVAFVAPGTIVFARSGTLVGQHFDPVTATITGEPFAIAESVRFFLTTGVASFSASPSGIIVYQSQRDRARLAWFDRSGHELRSVGSPGDYLDMRITSSGRTALLTRALPATGTFDVWSLDLERNSETRLTLDDTRTEIGAVMTPDAKTIVFSAPEGGPPRLIRKRLGTGEEEVLLPGQQFQNAEDVSPDGRLLAYSERSTGSVFHLWIVPLSGTATPSVLRRSTFNEGGLRFAPDGKVFTFLSDESGRREAYVSAVSGGVEVPVSAGGAVMARWSRDGREIYYLSPERRIVTVPVLRTTPTIELGPPVTLFTVAPRPWDEFDVSLDGKSFLALIPDLVAAEQPLTALLHWSDRGRR